MPEPRIADQLLPYHDRLELRDPATIDLIVIHCTELPTLEEAREMGERILYEGSGSGASGHYYIDRDGAITSGAEATMYCTKRVHWQRVGS